MLELDDERYYARPRDWSLALAPSTIEVDVESDILVHGEGLSRGYWWNVILVGRAREIDNTIQSLCRNSTY